MDRNEKKRLEKEFGIAFLKSIGQYNEDHTNHDDNPDFLVQNSDILGIEITEAFNHTQKGKSRIQVEGGQNRLLKDAKTVWDGISLPAAHITLTFQQDYYIPKAKSNKKAIEIVEFISRYVPPKGEWYESPNDLLINTPGLIGFSIERLVEYDTSIWSISNWIWPPILTSDIVQGRLDDKELKRSHYLKRCTKIWLVIVLNGGRASGAFKIPSETIEHAYTFHFDRTFLFDCIPGKHYELARTKDVT